MTSLYIVYLVLNLVVILTHAFALFLLFKVKSNLRNQTQAYLITTLCLSELGYASTYLLTLCLTQYGMYIGENDLIMTENNSIYGDNHSTILYILKYIDIFEAPFLATVYYAIMLIITMDRFFVFKLGVKYTLYWCPRRTKKLIITLAVIGIIAFTIYVVVDRIISITPMTFIPLIYFILDVTFIAIVTVTYVYIFKVFKEHKKHLYTRHRQKERFNLLVPTLVIITFIIFIIIPNIIRYLNSRKIIQLGDSAWVIFQFIYLIGYLADSLIYTFTLPSARKKLHSYRTRIHFSDTAE